MKPCMTFRLACLIQLVRTTHAAAPRIQFSSCGPSGTVVVEASPSATRLAEEWANDYERTCAKTSVSITSRVSTLGAQGICNASSEQERTIDIAILSRPFLLDEATSIDGFQFNCTSFGGSSNSRNALLLNIAYDAFVLVVAPNGTAEYCLSQLFSNSLNLAQLRVLFSNYSFLEETPSPSVSFVKPPIPQLNPSFPPKTDPPVTTIAITDAPTGAALPTHQPSNMPSVPKKVAVPPAKRPSRRPRTPRPTLPTATRNAIYWTLNSRFHIVDEGLLAFCSNLPALVAGPATSSDLYQDFARRILPDFDNGEVIKPLYYGSDNVTDIIDFLTQHNNSIAVLSLSDYQAHREQLSLVKVVDQSSNDDTRYPPNAENLISKLYPLGFNIFLAARSDDNDSTSWQRRRSFVEYAYSALGDIEILRRGLVPLPVFDKAKSLSLLASGTVLTNPRPNLVPTKVKRPSKGPITPKPKKIKATARPIAKLSKAPTAKAPSRRGKN